MERILTSGAFSQCLFVADTMKTLNLGVYHPPVKVEQQHGASNWDLLWAGEHFPSQLF